MSNLNSDKDLRRVPSHKAASHEEITSAIEALSDAELVRLKRYAAYRVRALGPERPGQAADELLKEALLSTLEGNRRWNKGKVPFFTFLVGAMRSISSHWREQTPEIRHEIRVVGDDALNDYASSSPDPEESLNAKQQWDWVVSFFADDADGLALLPELAAGMSAAEVRARMGWSANRYEATLKRVRRKLAKGGLNELGSS